MSALCLKASAKIRTFFYSANILLKNFRLLEKKLVFLHLKANNRSFATEKLLHL